METPASRWETQDTKVRFPTGGDRRDALQVREHQEDALLLPSLQMLDAPGRRRAWVEGLRVWV